MTPKQSRFIEEYMIDFNATQAAIRAGYSEKTAHNIGWENVRKRDIAEEIAKRVEALSVGKYERLQILADVARSGEKDSDRMRAVELLGKLAGDYTEKVEHSGEIDGRVTVIDYGLGDDDNDTD